MEKSPAVNDLLEHVFHEERVNIKYQLDFDHWQESQLEGERKKLERIFLNAWKGRMRIWYLEGDDLYTPADRAPKKPVLLAAARRLVM